MQPACCILVLKTYKLGCVVVKQDHPNIATVICINDAGANIDKVLVGEARPRGHPAVVAFGDCNRNVCLNQSFALRL